MSPVQLMIQYGKLALLLILCGLGLQLSYVVLQAQRELDGLGGEAHSLIQTAQSTILTVNREVEVLHQDLLGFSSAVARRADDQLTETRDRLDLQLSRFNTSVRLIAASVEEVSLSIEGVSKSVGSATQSLNQVGDKTAQLEDQLHLGLIPFLDCKGNSACLYSRWAAGSKAFIDTMGTLDKAAPEFARSTEQIAQNIAGITQDAHTYTSRFIAPRSTGSKLWEGLKLGAMVGSRVIPMQ